jgi:hypothetical protein
VLVPIAILASLAWVAAAIVLVPWTGVVPVLLGAFALCAISSLRAAGIIRRGRLAAPWLWAQGLVVALTFETARALALVGGATHATRARATAS